MVESTECLSIKIPEAPVLVPGHAVFLAVIQLDVFS